jgi:hypothetical protein
LTIALCLDIYNYKQLSTFAVTKKTSSGSNDAWLCRCPQRAAQEEPKGQRIQLSSLQAPSRGGLLKLIDHFLLHRFFPYTIKKKKNNNNERKTKLLSFWFLLYFKKIPSMM